MTSREKRELREKQQFRETLERTAMTLNAIYIASDMLGVDLTQPHSPVEQQLIARLEAVETMVKRVKPDGGLNSTQAVAVVVEQWVRENTDE